MDKIVDELRICGKDGPFRGDSCPVCGNRGKLLMRPDEVEGVGRVLAGMLRHFPENYGVRLNDHGWVKIYAVVPVIRGQRRGYWWLTPSHIEALVKTDPKGRYQINKYGEIRAAYGHTIPVNMDDLPTDDIPENLYYQTTREEMELIRETGISPSDKTWIHLSLTPRQAYVSGLFHIDSPAVLEIPTEPLINSGRQIYRATKDVFLVQEIPPEYIGKSILDTYEPTEEEQEEIRSVRERLERRSKRREEEGSSL
ncbi:MAG TPA: RNA 2'-phosphotransferase [Thermoplasmataceae archaeon]|nr:RNA 2'-phosphotransferase [Thermoplasmatales archaeon AK]HLH86117.1 RNA 2'-phosphotransferase [Thermoplasmataceae archaeon]